MSTVLSLRQGSATAVAAATGAAGELLVDNTNWKLYLQDGTTAGGHLIGGGTGTVTSVSVAGTSGQLTSSGSPITSSGTITLGLATTAVTAASYTNANLTVDAYGRITAASNGSPGVAGSNTQVQYNNAGALAGSANFTYVDSTETLNVGKISLTQLSSEALYTTTVNTTDLNIQPANGDATYTPDLALYGANATTTNGSSGDITLTTGSANGTGTSGSINLTSSNCVQLSTNGNTFVVNNDWKLNASVGSSGQVLTSNGTGIYPSWTTPATGSVTSVGVTTTSSRITVSGSPVTTSGNIALDLATTAVTAGSYTNANITVDAYGRITAASNGSAGGVSSFNTRTGAVTLTSGDVTTALGFTPGTGNGTVTAVSGSGVISSTGGTTPAISISQATTSTSGYLSSTDWNTFNSKGSGTVTSVTGTAPIVSSGGTTPAISMAAATTSVSGYLTSTDWNTFNSKGSGTVTAIGVTTANGVSGTSSGGATPNLTISLGAITPTSVAATGTVTGSNLSGTSSGTNTGDQTITLTGDVTGSGTGSFATTLAASGASAGTYGQVTVNTKGLVTSGTVATDATHGGTAQTSYTTGDILYASATNTLSKLGIGSSGQVLTVAAGIPSWAAGGGGGGTSYSDPVTTITYGFM